MKRNIEHAWTTATLVATAALAIALALAAVFFTRATAQGAALHSQASWRSLQLPGGFPGRSGGLLRRSGGFMGRSRNALMIGFSHSERPEKVA